MLRSIRPTRPTHLSILRVGARLNLHTTVQVASPKSSPRSEAPVDTATTADTARPTPPTATPVETIKGALARLRPQWCSTRVYYRDHHRFIKRAVGGALAVGAIAYFLSGDDGKNDPMLGRPNPADVQVLSRVPLSKLVSGWIVYAFCSSPLLIEWSEPLFKTLRQVPLLGYLVDDFARRTFFRQFFGEETPRLAAQNVWAPLRAEHVGVLTAYNVEAENYDSVLSHATIRECVEGTLDAIRKVGSFGLANSPVTAAEAGDTRCWVRTKVSGLLPDPQIMIRASEYIVANRQGATPYPGIPEDGDFDRLMHSPDLSPSDRQALQGLYGELRQFMRQGQKYGVRVILDAEQSWYQPAVDVMTEELMREFNSGNGPAIVCASTQGYLRRNTALLKSQFERAQRNGYKYIFKQVRGAYMPYERARWREKGFAGPPPVWDTKEETDAAYDTAMRMGLQAVKERQHDASKPDVAVIFATHNEVSVDNAIKYLEDYGMGTRQADGSLLIDPFVANRVAFAQIYGMKDNLTNRTAAIVKTEGGLPVVCKSAVYGTLEHALPNLSRRAAENKAVMEGRGGAIAERRRIGRELCRRYVPFYTSER